VSPSVRRSIVAAAAGVILFATVSAPVSTQVLNPSGRVPVLVELFTSEGCSSCPPADQLLTTLMVDQPIAGAYVIGLSEHVDYWDRLGWRDPFSSAELTARQSAYDRDVFHDGPIYTPQMIVDGQVEFVGSDARAATAAITRAAAEPAAVRLAVSAARRAPGLLARVAAEVVNPRPLKSEADIVVVVAEDGLVTQVGGGENRGRSLRHSAVARKLTIVGRVSKGSPLLVAEVPITTRPEWKLEHLRLVVFAQDRSSHRVLGAVVGSN